MANPIHLDSLKFSGILRVFTAYTVHVAMSYKKNNVCLANTWSDCGIVVRVLDSGLQGRGFDPHMVRF